MPEQLLSRFVRVNLALPDSVLLHDLAAFLKEEREALRKRGGPQPYREAVRLAEKKRPRLATLAGIGLLAYLDLQSWLREQNPPLSDYEVAALIGTSRNRMEEVRDYAERSMNDLALRAWLEPLSRGVPPKSRRR
jgi:hypothetical protein